MNLRVFEYILAVAEFGHFGKAAEYCHVSQPALSIQIKKFEDYYGVSLFERDPKTARLTHAGQLALPHIKAMLDSFETLEGTLRKQNIPEEGEFILGAFPTLAPFYLPGILPSLGKAFPRLKLFLVEERSPDLLDRLSDGKIDAALLALPLEDDSRLDIYPLFWEPLWAAVPSSHPLAKRKVIDLKNLEQDVLLLLEDSHCLSGQALEACAWAGLKHRHDFRATSIETLKHMVGSGLGVTLVPEMACDSLYDSVTYLPLRDKGIGRQIGLVARKTAPQRNFIAQFAKTLKLSAKIIDS